VIRTVTAWTGDIFEHPGALVLDRHQLAIDTDAAYEAMRSRTWRPVPASAVPRPRPASEAWYAAARRLHRTADVRYVQMLKLLPVAGSARDVFVKIGDNWLFCHIPPEAP
jgi:hypothetical protein